MSSLSKLLVIFPSSVQACHVDDCLLCCVFKGQLITPALRKYPMENFTWIPKGYITENWLVQVHLLLYN